MTLSASVDTHPLVRVCAELGEALDEVAGVDPIYASAEVKARALVGLSRLVSRVEGLRLQVLAASDDVAEREAARSAASWLAHATHADTVTVSTDAKLAARCESPWTAVGAALRSGSVSTEQARAIVWGLDRLPDELSEEIRARAEAYLLEQAADLAPRELRRLARGLLAHLAPDIADEHERKLLEDQEARAATGTRFSIRRRGDGMTDISGRVPDHVGHRLKRYLDAILNPRRDHHAASGGTGSETSDDTTAEDGAANPFVRPDWRVDPATGERLSYDRLLGDAFIALLEALPAEVLPSHGGTATQVIVMLDYDTLTGQLHAAGMLDDDTPITPGQARRLACQAGILPAVLGGTSEVLDLGRARRLHSAAQRKAHSLHHRTCQAAGCSIPWTWCESHHRDPWASGGATDLDTLEFLCSYHHHRTHDPTYIVTRHPDGTLTYHRRT